LLESNGIPIVWPPTKNKPVQARPGYFVSRCRTMIYLPLPIPHAKVQRCRRICGADEGLMTGHMTPWYTNLFYFLHSLLVSPPDHGMTRLPPRNVNRRALLYRRMCRASHRGRKRYSDCGILVQSKERWMSREGARARASEQEKSSESTVCALNWATRFFHSLQLRQRATKTSNCGMQHKRSRGAG
jgi:hypothetical protein